MAKFSLAATKTTAAAAGFLAQLRAGSTYPLNIFEIGVFATTAAAGQVALVRPSAIGATFTSVGPGIPEDNPSRITGAAAVIDTAATTAPTVAAPYMRIVQLPATIGAGIVWTFPDALEVQPGNAIDLWQLSAAAVGYAVYFSFDE